MTIKELEVESVESEEEQDDNDEWYTDIGTKEEKEIIKQSESYFFMN